MRWRSSAADLVGREQELADLVQAIARAPAVAVVEGPAGIGKTRLVTAACAHEAVAGRRVLTGHARRIGEPFPLGPLIDCVRDQADALAAVDLSPVTGALRPLVPELAAVLPARPDPVDDPLAERHRVFRGLVEVLGSLGPTVVVLEDLQWADEQTVEFVGYLTTTMPATVSVVATVRTEDAAARHRGIVEAAPADLSRAHLRLAPLDVTQTRQLASAIMEFPELSEEFGTYLWDRTSGLPLAIEELLALLRDRGTLIRHGSGWVRRALDDLDVPYRIRDAVLERAGRLSPSGRLVLDVAAVVQSALPAPTLIAIAQEAVADSAADAAGGLDEASAAGLLVVVDDGRLGVTHLLAAQALYEAIPADRRRQLHGLAASVLGAVPHPPLGQVAHHLRHAGRMADWTETAERAADLATDLGHHTEACHLLDEVVRFAEIDSVARGRAAVKLARAAQDAVHGVDDLSDLLLHVLEQDLPVQVRGELRFLTGLLIEQAGGDPAVQRRLYVHAVAELEHRPDLRAWAMIGLGIPSVADVPAAEHLDWVHRALRIVPTVQDPARQVFLWGKAAMVLAPAGDPTWRDLVRRVEACSGGDPTGHREINAYDSVGIELCCVGHHRDAERLLEAGLHGARRSDSPKLVLRLQSSEALLRYCTGRWGGLAESVAQLRHDLADYPHERVTVDVVHACLTVTTNADDTNDAVASLAATVDQVRQAGAIDLLPLPAAVLIRALLARGEPDTAADLAETTWQTVVGKGLWAPAMRMLPPYVAALSANGQVDQASGLVERVADAVSDLDTPLATAALHAAAATVADARNVWSVAVAEAEAAAAAYRSALCPYEMAHAAELAAHSRCLATEGEDADERERTDLWLSTAVDTYRDLGARRDLARVARLARSRGIGVPGRHRGGRRGYGSALSPREQEVAELVMVGKTNEEIGRTLFLSVKTVEKHVSAARRKLGAPSRAAFAVYLAGADARIGAGAT